MTGYFPQSNDQNKFSAEYSPINKQSFALQISRLFYIWWPFHTTGLFLYPLNKLENQMFSDAFRGHRKRPVAWNGLISSSMEFIQVWSSSSEISDNKVLTFCKLLLNVNILFPCPFLPLIDPLLVQQALKRSFRSKHIHLVKGKIQTSQLLIIFLTRLMSYEKHSLTH